MERIRGVFLSEFWGSEGFCSLWGAQEIAIQGEVSHNNCLACLKRQLTCNLDLVPVWGCLVPVLPFFYIFHLLSAGFYLLSAGFALLGEREKDQNSQEILSELSFETC